MPQLSALFNGKWNEREGYGLLNLLLQILLNHHSINQSDYQISSVLQKCRRTGIINILLSWF